MQSEIYRHRERELDWCYKKAKNVTKLTHVTVFISRASWQDFPLKPLKKVLTRKHICIKYRANSSEGK